MWRADTIQLIQLFSILLIQLFNQVNVVSHPVIPAQDERAGAAPAPAPVPGIVVARPRSGGLERWARVRRRAVRLSNRLRGVEPPATSPPLHQAGRSSGIAA
jgi:hypothetical protein